MSKIIKIATWNIGQDLKNNEINKASYEYIKEQIEQIDEHAERLLDDAIVAVMRIN